MSLINIKLVTFDVTNTLLKFKVPAWKYYAMVAHDHGFQGTEEEVKSKFRKSFSHMWEKHPNYGKKTIQWEDWWRKVVSMTLKNHLPNDADMDLIANKLINEFRTDRCWSIAHGGDQLIDQFRKLGVSVGVISNFDPRLNEILKNLSLHKSFDFIVTSYEIGYTKPDERIFKGAIDKCAITVSPSEALHIGDDVLKDYEGARAAGWHALLVNSKLDSQKKPLQKHVFKDLLELCSSIQQRKLIL